MKGILNPDSLLVRIINRFGQIWWLNILWIICSLPIVTIGASTTALIYSCMKLRKDEGYATKNFFASFKENFSKSTILWFCYALIFIMLGSSVIFWNQHKGLMATMAWLMALFLTILYFISLLYVFAILARYKLSIKNAILFSLVVAGKNIIVTVILELFLAGIVILNLTQTLAVNLITLNIGVGITVYILSFYYNKVFEKR